jgi:uncharacterized protein with LGFP repeats
MNRQRGVLRTVFRRVALGVLAATTTILLAPTAAATPEADADNAITAAWAANGGATGPLGARDGVVYPVGAGFGQNFASGTIFFSPGTGARMMQGAILEKYKSLGGPADSDLGFPTIDEGPGRIGPDSRNSTFSAADKPVIFWTPATGARVVRGAINAAWDKLGGSAGPLGVPTEDEVYRGDVVSQKFTGGELSWNRADKKFTTVPPALADQLGGLAVPNDPTSAINTARRAAGGPLGPLGAAKGPQYPIGADGVGQDFAGGKIFYSPATGANVVTGQVLEKYQSVGGPEGDLGFPTSSEVEGGLGPNSRVVTFAAEDRPVIFWTPDYGPVIVRGAMNAAWSKLDGAEGRLGAPIADQTDNGDLITQRFSGGAISWDKSANRFTTEPPDLATSLSGLDVPGLDVPQAPPAAPAASGPPEDTWFTRHWNWWWLLAVVPVVVLAAFVGGAVLLNRRRGRDDNGRFGAAEGELGAYVPVPVSVGHPGTAEGGELMSDRHAEAPEASRFLPGGGADSPASPDPWGFQVAESAHDLDRDEPDDQADPDAELFAGQPDPDTVDTAPTRIEVDPDAHSGRHAVLGIDQAAPGRTAIHLPLEDPHEAPDGYPIKADTKSGLFWSPDSGLYDDAIAEIWFASEELARANGFVSAD